MRPYAFAGGTAVVTGAAGGIGAALARGLAARGSSLALLDRDGPRLEALADDLRAAHPRSAVRTYVVDLGDAPATARCLDAVLADHPRITLVVNNAGVALGGTFDQVSLEDVTGVLDVNLRATVQVTHALQGALRAAPGSHLVVTSSLFGLLAPPGQAAYAASKFALRGFAEALRAELAPAGVGVTCVHPGGVATDIATSARVGAHVPPDQGAAGRRAFAALLTIPPDVAAATILAGVERRRARVMVGASARAADVAARATPVHSAAVLRAMTLLLRRRSRS